MESPQQDEDTEHMTVQEAPSASENAAQRAKMGSVAGSDNETLRTLDEPVTRTIMRDLRMIATKLKYVLVPRGGTEETLKSLRDWDLCMYCLFYVYTMPIVHKRRYLFIFAFVASGGPLVLCLSLSM